VVNQPSRAASPVTEPPMYSHPSYIVIVAHAGQPGIRIASAHATEADAKGMIDMLSSLVSPGSAVYLLPMPGDNGIIGSVIEPVNEVKASVPLVEHPGMHIKPGAIITDNGEGPVTLLPAEKPAPFRRRSAAEFEEETRAMMENGEMRFRDADAPLGDGGAFS
jgi:hypothetical protein